MTVKFKLYKAGYCEALESHAIRGGARKKIPFDATFAVIHHPEKGVVLFDTGYTDRFFFETEKFPEKIYAKVTKVYIPKEEEAAEQLKKEGINADDIQHVIISHFHADHVGGLKDFPNATFYCSAQADEQLQHKSGFGAVKKGIIKGLIPSDFNSRKYLIDNCKKVENKYFNKTYDLFNDGSIILVDLHGHGAGQIGAILNTENQKTFLVADACWLTKSYKEFILPNSIVRLFFDSWKSYKDNLRRLHEYHKANPKTIIIPTHCNATTDSIIKSQNK